MVSRQRQRALEVFEAEGPLGGRGLADRLGCSQESARKLIQRMLADGILRRADGEASDGYTLREGATEASEAVQADHTDRASESHGVTAPTGRDSHRDADEDDAEYPGHGIGVYNAQTGRSMRWRNKATEGPYPS